MVGVALCLFEAMGILAPRKVQVRSIENDLVHGFTLFPDRFAASFRFNRVDARRPDEHMIDVEAVEWQVMKDAESGPQKLVQLLADIAFALKAESKPTTGTPIKSCKVEP